MTTSYLVSWLTRAGFVRRWYVKKFETETEARAFYERKSAQPNVTFASLCRKDHPSDGDISIEDALSFEDVYSHLVEFHR